MGDQSRDLANGQLRRNHDSHGHPGDHADGQQVVHCVKRHSRHDEKVQREWPVRRQEEHVAVGTGLRDGRCAQIAGGA